jgi:hypothetical protein
VPAEQLAEFGKKAYEKLLNLKGSIGGMKEQVDRTQNESLRSGLNSMREDYQRQLRQWQRIQKALGKSDAIPAELSLPR